MFQLSSIYPNGPHFWHQTTFNEYEENLFFRFLIFCPFGSFWIPERAKNCDFSDLAENLTKTRLKMTQKHKISKIEKTSSLPIH